MAGKESNSEDGGRELCWRKEVDRNLKRLQSLLYGADAALEKGDFASAQVLSLMLVGFLNSRSLSSVDEAFIRPISREALHKLRIARSSLIPDSDRQAFAQAGKVLPGVIFKKTNDAELETITQSTHFQSLLRQSSGGEVFRSLILALLALLLDKETWKARQSKYLEESHTD
ncbi:hypothetical protein M569_03838 [Genlisea aurea]|uniref:FIGL1 N-terminal domain-containing protein n=1 Tax=Genlisea aurea TaxID=192259 RepID=S8CU76_9LAMI|nr:hypothetical protein M569_03838 [Genlisea aurea]